MQFNHSFRKVVLAISLVLGTTAAAQAQEALSADQNSHYKESRDKYLAVSSALTHTQGTTAQQTYNAYQYFEAKEKARQQRRQWRQERRMARNTWYDGCGYDGYPYPLYRNACISPFRWNDVASITAMALGAYMLFR